MEPIRGGPPRVDGHFDPFPGSGNEPISRDHNGSRPLLGGRDERQREGTPESSSRRAGLRWVVLAIALAPARSPAGEGTLAVEVDVPERVYHVGEGLELRVGLIAGVEVPQALPLLVPGARVTPIDSGPRKTSIVSTGIGDVVSERIHYAFRFRIVPERAGPLTIPPVGIRLGDQFGSSDPVRLTIRPLPPGQPSAFLGGVGTLQVGAEAEPTTIRIGQTIELRIRLDGTAARGSSTSPDLDAFGALPLGPRVEPLTTQAMDQPPWRIFRYRLRFERAGEVVLPPVPVAYFDPEARQYFTRTTPGVPIKVVDVPAYNPANLDYAPPPGRSPTISGATFGRAGLGRMVVVGIIACLAMALAVAFARRHRARRGAGCRRLAARIARGFGVGIAVDQVADEIHDGLVAYFALASGRPPGVLTPSEAARVIERISGDRSLAQRAEALVAACDEVRFGRESHANAGPILGDRARTFFQELGRCPIQTTVWRDGES